MRYINSCYNIVMELFREIVRNEFPIFRYDLIHSKMHKLSLILVSKEIKHSFIIKSRS